MATSSASHPGSFTLLHVRGVPIRLHWTLLLFIPYLAFVISAQFGMIERIAGMEQVRLHLPPLVWGALLAVGLFASIAIHELAHTFVSTHYGGKVRAITLMLLGGVSQAVRMPRRPLHEGLMALAGPATSISLGLLIAIIDRALPDAADDLKLGLFYLAWMNLMLGLFNLIPAFPMDGGRILRALLAGAIGRERATTIAAAVGRALAVAIGVLGLWAGNWLLILIAVFVFVGAGAEALGERVQSVLAGLRIGDLVPALRRLPTTIEEGETLATALTRMHEIGRLDLVVVDREGSPISVIEARDLAFVPVEDRPAIHLGSYLRARPPRHVVVPWDAQVTDTLKTAIDAGARHLVVVDPRLPPGARVLGTITPEEIETAARLRMMDTSQLPPSRASAEGTA